MLVRKVIEKEVHYCQECPYYEEWSDMGARIPVCLAGEKFKYLTEINRDNKIISKTCPLKEKSVDNASNV